MAKKSARVGKAAASIGDAAKFLHSWSRRPLLIGSVTPSGKALSRTMASAVDPHGTGPVIEIGPGTGPVTDALIRHGVAESRLVLVEYNADFVHLLARRYPRATVIRGDAYALKDTLAGTLAEPAAAVVSSLPLFTKPEAQRLALLKQAFGLMQPNAPFVQFTYAVVSPMPLRHGEFAWTTSPRVWLNVPPARVWIYRQAQS